MDAKTAIGAQRDEQWEATPEAVARSAAEALLKDVHTCLPGIVRSFDAASQTASVQPAVRRRFVEAGDVDLPLCVDVPVVFPRGGNFVLTFPVSAGDECLLIFSERAIDFWFDRGGVQLPAEVRFHDLSDAFALVGVSSKPRWISDFNANAVELRMRDGSLILRMDDTTIKLGVGSEQKAVLGDNWKAMMMSLLDAIESISVPTAVGPSGPPLNVAQFEAIRAALDDKLSGTVFVKP